MTFLSFQVLPATKLPMIFTFPANTYLSSNHFYHGKADESWNCLCLVQHFLWTKIPEPVCFRMKLSSSNFSLWMDLLRMPVSMVKSLPHESWNNSLNRGSVMTKSLLYSALSMSDFFWNFANISKKIQPWGSTLNTISKNTGVDQSSTG